MPTVSPIHDPAALLQVRDLHFSYPQQTLFGGWACSIPAGLTSLCGDEGSGKTTLLRLLAGELPADEGQFEVRGVRLDPQTAAYRQQVFWANPRSDALDQITAVAYFASLRPRYPTLDVDLLEELVDVLGLTQHRDKPMYMLSTGSKRKVWLAAAFASGTAVTLLDDPLAALDAASVDCVMELLEDAADHPSRAWVVAHHDPLDGLALAATISLDGRAAP
jgi:ABC-type multidrug transport system ATPase subunit